MMRVFEVFFAFLVFFIGKGNHNAVCIGLAIALLMMSMMGMSTGAPLEVSHTYKP